MTKENLHAKLEKALVHVAKSNAELGSVDARLGRIEGQLTEALPDIKNDIGEIFKKFNGMPCVSHGERLTRIETNLKLLIKSRWVIFTGLVSLVVYLISRFI